MNILPLLHQRLELYRFAYVMVDPAQLPSRGDWQLPHLQASNPHESELTGRLRLPTPVFGERGPVLSTSIQRLRHFRKREARRPLILMRPAFEHAISPSRLAGLAKVPEILRRLFVTDDAYTPLEWRRPLLARQAPVPYIGDPMVQRHPMLQYLHRLRKLESESQYYIQEDGHVLEQPSLLNFGARTSPKMDATQLQDYDRLWYERFGFVRGHCYVMSRSLKALQWFARDSLRLLGPYAYRWFYPMEPDIRNAGINWILVQDQAMRWVCLPRAIPCVHLDQDESSWQYRALRTAQGGRVRWRTSTPLISKAILQFAQRQMLCQDRGSGWQLAFCENAAEDRSQALRRRLDQIATLSA